MSRLSLFLVVVRTTFFSCRLEKDPLSFQVVLECRESEHLAERQLGLANDNFSEYVVDRLELFIVNISSLAEHFQLHSNEETAVIGAWYSSHLNELVVCLRSLLGQWLDYLNHSHIRTNSSYNVPLAHNLNVEGQDLIFQGNNYSIYVQCHLRGHK